MNKYISVIGTNLAVAALFYAWQFHGMEWCGNVVLFALWSSSVIWTLAGLTDIKPDHPVKPPLVRISRMSAKFFALWLAADGYFVLAGFLAMSAIAQTAVLSRSEKAA